MIRVLAPSNPFWANSERAASSIAALVSIARCCSRRFVVRFRVPVCTRRVRRTGGLITLGFGSFMIGASTGRCGQYGRFKLLRRTGEPYDQFPSVLSIVEPLDR